MAMSSYSPSQSVLNPVVGNAPASIPTNNAMDLFAAWVDAYEKKQFPIQSMIKRRNTPFDQDDIKVGQSYNPFITTTLGATTATDSSVVSVASATYMREGDVIEIIAYYSGSTTELDYSTREVAVIDSISGSNLTCYRDSGRTSSGSWPTNATNSYVRVIGSAVAYNQPFRDSPVFRGDWIYNKPQRFDAKLSGDIAGINTPDFESKDHFEREIKNKTLNLKWELDNMLVSGWRMVGDAVTGDGNAKPNEMGGILWWIHQANSANRVDLASTQLTIYDLRDILRTVWKNNARGAATTLLMGPDTYEIVSMLLNAYKQGGFNDTSITLDVESINNLHWGNLKPKPIFGFPEGTIAFIDPADWEYGPYKGCNWQVVRREPEHTDRPTREWAMWGQFSLICTDIQRQCLIKGIDTRLNNYLGRSSFVM